MLLLKQSTAATVKIGPFLDDADGKTVEAALTISQGDVRLSKNGANIAQKNDATACTYDEVGVYDCPLDATDTGSLGRLQLWVAESGALPVWHEFMVVPANVYDALCGTELLTVDVSKISGDSTAADNCELMFDGTGYAGGTTKLDVNTATVANNAITAAAIANGAIDAATFAADADAEIAAMIWNAATASYGGAGTYGQAVEDTIADTNEMQGDLANGGRLDLLVDAIKAKTDSLTFTVAGDVDCNVQTWKGSAAADMTGDAYARIGAPVNASISQDVAAVKSDTAAILADTGTDGVVVAAGSKTGYSLTADQSAVTVGTVTTLTGHTAQTGDSFALANGANGFVAIKGDTAAVLADTGTDGVVVAAASKTGYTLSNDGVDAVWDRASTLTLSFETMLTRIYRFLNNRMVITNATGAVALRNEANDGDIASQSITDDDTNTLRTAITWS
jgi:hypothetical protein